MLLRIGCPQIKGNNNKHNKSGDITLTEMETGIRGKGNGVKKVLKIPKLQMINIFLLALGNNSINGILSLK
jgi:hypothetical protein